MRLAVEQGMKAGRAFGGDDAGVDEEGDELVPREVMCGGHGVGEIEGEATSDQAGFGAYGSHKYLGSAALASNRCWFLRWLYHD